MNVRTENLFYKDSLSFEKMQHIKNFCFVFGLRRWLSGKGTCQASPKFQTLDAHGEKRELIPARCPPISLCAMHAHTHLRKQISKYTNF